MENEEDKNVEYIFAEDNLMLFEIFKHYASNYLNDKIYSHSLQLPNLFVGSKQLKQIAWKAAIENVNNLVDPVCEFVEHIWNVAIGDLNDILDIDLRDISIQQVIFFSLFY